ncbi:MAG TPA: hypothetical protein EYH31_13945 [Anaerolineae bacterium]|nr:hypothetical protein [Anaerolineae bacterium]
MAFVVLFSVFAYSFGDLVAQRPEVPPTPTKTPKPTFTPTPANPPTPTPLPPTPTPLVPPTATPTATPVIPTNTPVPTPTPIPPTPTPKPPPQIVVDADRVNVREGPGTAYRRVGQVTRGQRFEIVGKNPRGDWWQICCVNGRQVWIVGRLVRAEGNIAGVQVAQNIPTPPPTPTPRPPTPTPIPQPTPTPRPQYVYNRALLQRCDPNAGITYIEGTVYDAASRPTNGIKVVFSYAPDGPIVADYITGTDPGKPGRYTHILQWDGPRAGDWYVWVVDGSGRRISEIAHVHTDGTAGPGKCQQAIIDFAP